MFFRHDGQWPLSWEGDLELPRAILHHFGISKGVRIFIASEIPPGTGLGCSSSVSVGLIKAIAIACGLNWTPGEIAELASFIEIEKMGSPIGKQDQYAAAFGGLNLIEFEESQTRVTPLNVSPGSRIKLARSLTIFYTGRSRSANEILSRQKESSRKKNGATLEALHRVKAMVPRARQCLETGNIRAFGRLLHENWNEKKRFASGVSNSHIDNVYEAALDAGAYGGKITGAGGGGFLLVCSEECCRDKITAVLERKGLVRVGFDFDDLGARVIMNSGLLLTSRHEWNTPKELLSKVA